jgi:membrane protein YqaA with SNARE-associated domain
MDPSILTEHAGPSAATLLVSLVSAVVPFVSIEVFLLAMAAAVPAGYPVWVLGVVAAVGQMAGKSLLYWSAAAATSSRTWHRVDSAKAAGLQRRLTNMNPWVAQALTFVSALAGTPPFILLACVAGAARMAFGPFLLVGFAGRTLRLVAVALAGAGLKSVLP